MNCGLCVDERGVGEAIDGVRRGSPADFWKMSVESGNTLTDRHALKEEDVKTLQVLETAYRATVEEQDDTIVWLTHAMAGAGGEFGLLLTGNAVCYAVQEQRAPALTFGGWKQSHAADLGADVAALAAKGVPLYAVEEDLEERGLLDAQLIEPLKVVPRANLPRLFDEYPRVWKW